MLHKQDFHWPLQLCKDLVSVVKHIFYILKELINFFQTEQFVSSDTKHESNNFLLDSIILRGTVTLIIIMIICIENFFFLLEDAKKEIYIIILDINLTS